MTQRSKWPGIYAAALLLVAVAIAFLSPGGGTPAQALQAGMPPPPMPDLAGNWAGTWTDVVFMSQEYAMTWQISQSREGYTASGVIDFSYFAMGPVAGTASGSVTPGARVDTLHFIFDGAGVGSGSGWVSGAAGAGSGSVYFPFMADFTFEGTVSETLIEGTFDFPTGGHGWARMAKQETPVEPSSWGSIKARYRDGGE